MRFERLSSESYPTYYPDIYTLLVDVYVSNFGISNSDAQNISKDKLDLLKDYLAESKAIVVLATTESCLVGFIWLYRHWYFGEERLHVNQFVVRSEFRGQGVGKQLATETEKIAVELGVSAIDLVVSEYNHVAVNLYKELGFSTERLYMKKQLTD